jgi:hypothetical protein
MSNNLGFHAAEMRVLYGFGSSEISITLRKHLSAVVIEVNLKQ